MSHHIAHLLRRTARRMLAWSNKIDPPAPAPVVTDLAAAEHRLAEQMAKARRDAERDLRHYLAQTGTTTGGLLR